MNGLAFDVFIVFLMLNAPKLNHVTNDRKPLLDVFLPVKAQVRVSPYLPSRQSVLQLLQDSKHVDVVGVI
jgi:hypothetical protein